MKNKILFLLLTVILILSCGGNREDEPVNVLLVIIDTLNADHLGCYGYHCNTSPTNDNIAASKILFNTEG